MCDGLTLRWLRLAGCWMLQRARQGERSLTGSSPCEGRVSRRGHAGTSKGVETKEVEKRGKGTEAVGKEGRTKGMGEGIPRGLHRLELTVGRKRKPGPSLDIGTCKEREVNKGSANPSGRERNRIHLRVSRGHFSAISFVLFTPIKAFPSHICVVFCVGVVFRRIH